MVLSIYPTSSGQWAGKLVDEDGQEVVRISGCKTPEAVKQEAQDGGFSDFTVTLFTKTP